METRERVFGGEMLTYMAFWWIMYLLTIRVGVFCSLLCLLGHVAIETHDGCITGIVLPNGKNELEAIKILRNFSISEWGERLPFHIYLTTGCWSCIITYNTDALSTFWGKFIFEVTCYRWPLTPKSHYEVVLMILKSHTLSILLCLLPELRKGPVEREGNSPSWPDELEALTVNLDSDKKTFALFLWKWGD